MPSVFVRSVFAYLVFVAVGVGCGLNKRPGIGGAFVPQSISSGSPATQQAMAVLSRCLSCHTQTSSPEALVASGWAVPGNAAGSPVYVRVMDGTMPPGAPLSASDRRILGDWIQVDLLHAETAPGALPSASPAALPPAGASPLAAAAFSVLQNKCASCHRVGSPNSGGMDYILDFQKLIAMGQAVPGNAAGSPLYQSVSAGRMPQSGPLGTTDLATLYNWIQTDLKAGASQPQAVVVPLAATFKSISANILVPRCTGCHGGTRPSEGISYDTYALTLRTVSKGRPTSSKLYTAIIRGSMPPGKDGDLSAAESKVVSDWIADGALDN